MNRYEIVVVEMASPSTAEKFLFESPLESMNASAITTVDSIPDSTLANIGVPNRDENRPSNLGPAPSNAATASARSAPINQVAPLDALASMNPSAATSPINFPSPVSVTVPSAATDPP